MVKRMKKKPSARRAVKRKPRRSYKRVTKADKIRKLFEPLSREELGDKSGLDAILKKAGINAVGTDIYRIRNEFLKSMSAKKEESDVSLKKILLVKRTADQVGGIDCLKSIISLIERVQE